MIVEEHVGFAALDWMLGQTQTAVAPAPVTTVAPAPVPAPTPVPVPAPVPVPMASIPIVQLGPVRIMDRNGIPITRINATVRTAGKIIGFFSAPGGIFQTNIDRADFDMGAVIIFGASGYRAMSVPAAAVVCNYGTRNEQGVVTSMSANQCPFYTYNLEPVAVTPVPPGPPAYAPAYGYRRPPMRRRPVRRPPPRRSRGPAPEAVEETAPAAPVAPPAPAAAPVETTKVAIMGDGPGGIPMWAYFTGGAALLVIAFMAVKD